MKRALLLVVLLGASATALAVGACSGSDTNIADAGKETGPLDTGPQCPGLPNVTCYEGAPYKACGSSPQPLKKVFDGSACPDYVCPPGTVPVNQCACNAESNKVDAGADCPGAPVDSGSD